MSWIKIIKALESKGYKVESAEYSHPSGGLADDYPESGGWVVFIEGKDIPMQWLNYKTFLKEFDALCNFNQ